MGSKIEVGTVQWLQEMHVQHLVDAILTHGRDFSTKYPKVFECITDGIVNGKVLEVEDIADYYFKNLHKLNAKYFLYRDVDSVPEELEAKLKYYQIGQVKGIMDILADLSYREKERRKAQELYDKYIHMYKILKCIFENDYITRKDLAEKTGLNTNILYKFFKRVEGQDLFNIYKLDKESVYSLTRRGRKYFEYMKEYKVSRIKEAVFKEYLESVGLSEID